MKWSGFLFFPVFIAILFCTHMVIKAAETEKPDSEYLIQPEDILEITVWPDATMSSTITVRPDGMISYPFLGQIKAEGMTVDVLTTRIRDSLQGYINDPKVAVNITNFRHMRAFILGSVTKPGVYDIRKGDTIMDLITNAGGFTKEAKKSQVALIRPPENLKAITDNSLSKAKNIDVKGVSDEEIMKYVTLVDVAELLGQGEFPNKNSYQVDDGDIIFVPAGKKMDWRKLYDVVSTLYFSFRLDEVINLGE